MNNLIHDCYTVNYHYTRPLGVKQTHKKRNKVNPTGDQIKLPNIYTIVCTFVYACLVAGLTGK